MRIKIDLDSAIASKFKEVFLSHDRYIIAYGGRGSSKTDTLYLKYLLELFQPYYFRLAYINKELSAIRDAQYAGFKRVAKRVGLYDYLKFYDGDYRVINLTNGNALIPKGMDDPEKTKGLDGISAIWWDEINKGLEKDYQALNELLRSPQAEYLQFALSFNPVSENHWLRHHFFDPNNRHKLHDRYKGKALLHHSTYKDNEFIDRESYLQTLLDGAAGDEQKIQVNVHGDWGNEENKSPWLFNFDRKKHVKDTITFLPSFPVYLSFDFNREPFTCVASQMSVNKGFNGSFIHHIKEFIGDMQIDEMCEQIKATFPHSDLFVTGDCSGNKKDLTYTSRNTTAYSLIQQHLKLGDRQMMLNTRNLEHSDSRRLMNQMLYHYPNIYFSKDGCPNLINDCEIAEVDEKSNKPGHLKKDRDKFKMDLFDGLRYFYQTHFNDFFKNDFNRLLSAKK